ncbi:Serpin domain-containing protein [Strongyloides ratti]|uniref:Serpin domain-containing protein n=1 Tax=Strongyloides ratti TaxID=34506 RepID=A0A090LSB9_STRRB|nr:Serpin domain-containing protein [Strongyloides ratti]CEF70503.1 Serpin domain-containing protein [Strongyloides ratti]
MNTSSIIGDQILMSFTILKEVNRIFDDSFVYSPISLILSLVILLIGSKGDTEIQIKNLVSPNFSREEIFSYYSLINKKLEDDNLFVILKSFNKGFITNEYEINDNYKNLIGNYFNGSIEQIQFSDIPHSTEKINNIVSNSTNGNIPKIIELNEISIRMKFILLSALYFKGDWHVKFEKTDTKIVPFYVKPNETKEVYIMSLENKFSYFENNYFQLVQLPYLGKNMKMIIILPKNKYNHDNFIENILSIDNFEYALNNMEKIFIKVMIPKFDIQSSINVTPILKNLGIVDAFNEIDSNFSEITNNSALYIDEIKQKAKIEITETGTEAAAITSIRLSLYSGAEINDGEVKIFRADHAFSFYIIDNNFNIYFSGIFK